jgi:hypothetical protein
MDSPWRGFGSFNSLTVRVLGSTPSTLTQPIYTVLAERIGRVEAEQRMLVLHVTGVGDMFPEAAASMLMPLQMGYRKAAATLMMGEKFSALLEKRTPDFSKFD